MAKASFTLRDGTAVAIDGTVEEIRDLLSHFGNRPPQDSNQSGRKNKRPGTKPSATGPGVGLSEIVNKIKTCEEAEAIEANILNRSSEVDRTLLPLYIVHVHFPNATGLSSGEISKIMAQLNVKILQPHVSRMLSGSAIKYVIGDRLRVKGKMVRYKLSRPGLAYLKAVIAGAADENEA